MIINLTPHTINVASTAIAPSGVVARVSSSTKKVGEVEVDGFTVDIVETVFGEVEGLPAPEPGAGVWFLVSALVRIAAQGRTDLLSPGEQVRNAAGQVVGCKNLTR